MENNQFYRKPQIGDKVFVDNEIRKESNLYELLDTSPMALNHGIVIKVYNEHEDSMSDYVDVLINTGKNKGKIIHNIQYNSLKCFPFDLYLRYIERVTINMFGNSDMLKEIIDSIDKNSSTELFCHNVIKIDFKARKR